jgi:hypothetical protein
MKLHRGPLLPEHQDLLVKGLSVTCATKDTLSPESGDPDPMHGGTTHLPSAR